MNLYIKSLKAESALNIELHNDFIVKLQITYDESNYSLRNDKILPKIECAKKEIHAFFGDNELIQHIKFGVTTKQVEKIFANTPIAEIETDKAIYVAIFESLSLVNGNLISFSAELGNYTPTKPKLGNPLVSFFLKEFIKGLGKAVVKETYKEIFPKDRDKIIRDEMSKLREDLKDFFIEIKYENLEDIMIATRVWLREDYSVYLDAYNNGKQIPYLDIHKDLKVRQEQLQNITSVIEARISEKELKECSYATRNKFMLYTACAVLRIIILKEQMFFESVLTKNGFGEYDNNVLKELIESFTKKIKKFIKDTKEKLYNGRLDFISSNVTHFEENTTKVSPVGMNGASNYYQTVQYGYKWEDNFESKIVNDPFKGDKIKSSKIYKVKDDKNSREDEVKKELSESLKNHKDDVIRIFKEKISDIIEETTDKLEKSSKIFFIHK